MLEMPPAPGLASGAQPASHSSQVIAPAGAAH